MTKIKIYSGLSLTAKQVHQKIPLAQMAPPIRRNDLYHDIKQGIHVVGIVDGEFQQSLAVSPSEIMDALRSGVKIYGSSSMGALRASELKDYGMIGCGLVYEYIASSLHFKDDHLGQVFFHTKRASSLPMIDFSISLDLLAPKYKLLRQDIQALKKMFESLHFTDRDLGNLTQLVRKEPNPTSGRMLKIIQLVAKQPTSIKTMDGVQLLRQIQQDLLRLSQLRRKYESFA